MAHQQVSGKVPEKVEIRKRIFASHGETQSGGSTHTHILSTSAKMPHLCNFIKQSNHQPCGHAVAIEGNHCGMHAPIAARMPVRREHQCEHIVGGNHWCARDAVDGDRLCQIHVGRRAREAADEARMAEAIQQARAARIEEARAQVNAAHAARAAAAAAGHAEHVELWERLDAQEARRQQLAAAVRVVPMAEVPNPLARFAADRQNVHTAAVTRQTNAGEAKLLAAKTDGKGVGLRILRVFATRGGYLHDVLRVMNDIDTWYSHRTCREPGDRLYGRMLEGLWALIEQQPEEQRKELRQRLWEEASESVGMCCEGHISRLVNVMSGFDDAFKPRQSEGEILQAKMAELAGMDIPDADKLAQARAFMGTLAMDAAAQAPWLEALA